MSSELHDLIEQAVKSFDEWYSRRYHDCSDEKKQKVLSIISDSRSKLSSGLEKSLVYERVLNLLSTGIVLPGDEGISYYQKAKNLMENI